MELQKIVRFLSKRDKAQRACLEAKRKDILKNVMAVLAATFANTNTEVYIIGSLIEPYKFKENSDIDIVVKNYQGDHFLLWSKLEEKFARKVDLIIFERCGFQKEIQQYGLKIKSTTPPLRTGLVSPVCKGPT